MDWLGPARLTIALAETMSSRLLIGTRESEMIRPPAGEVYRLVLGALVALTIIVSAHGVSATGSHEQIAQGAYDEETIERFVVAARQVSALRLKYEPLLQATKTKFEAQTLVDEARELMNTAIENVGFTVDEYTNMARAAQADPTLRARVESMLATAQ